MCAAGHLLALWARPTRRRFEPSLGPQVQAAQPVGLVALAKSIGAANGDRAELLRRAHACFSEIDVVCQSRPPSPVCDHQSLSHVARFHQSRPPAR